MALGWWLEADGMMKRPAPPDPPVTTTRLPFPVPIV